MQVSSVVSNFETENLEIYENTNGQIMIRNLSLITIKSMEDLYHMLKEGVIIYSKFLKINLLICKK